MIYDVLGKKQELKNWDNLFLFLEFYDKINNEMLNLNFLDLYLEKSNLKVIYFFDYIFIFHIIFCILIFY